MWSRKPWSELCCIRAGHTRKHLHCSWTAVDCHRAHIPPLSSFHDCTWAEKSQIYTIGITWCSRGFQYICINLLSRCVEELCKNNLSSLLASLFICISKMRRQLGICSFYTVTFWNYSCIVLLKIKKTSKSVHQFTTSNKTKTFFLLLSRILVEVGLHHTWQFLSSFCKNTH